MLENNILTVNIDDALTDSTISIKLPKELMYKLYRIKEINNYDSLFEYGGYNVFCDAIRDIIHQFHLKINEDYYTLLEFAEQGKIKNNDVNEAVKCMDSLISKGYEYNDAFTITAEKYFR